MRGFERICIPSSYPLTSSTSKQSTQVPSTLTGTLFKAIHSNPPPPQTRSLKRDQKQETTKISKNLKSAYGPNSYKRKQDLKNSFHANRSIPAHKTTKAICNSNGLNHILHDQLKHNPIKHNSARCCAANKHKRTSYTRFLASSVRT